MTTNDLDLATVEKLESIFDQRYVLQSDCDEKQAGVSKRFANDDKRIEIIMHDFKIIKWLLATLATSSISALVVSIFELITK